MNIIQSCYYVKPSILNQNKNEVWKLHSIDKLTLDTGFSLGTCWIFQQNVDINKMATSLSLLLNEYRVFAGRYSEWDRCVKLNDSGVKFQVAKDDEYDLEKAQKEHHLEHFSSRFIDESSSIIGYRILNAPLMTVRITFLQNGGSIVGVRATHGVCDGDTFYSMMERWSKLARGSLQPSKAIFDQYQIPYNPNRRDYQQVKQALKDEGYGIVSLIPAAFRLSLLLLKEGIILHNKIRSNCYHISNQALGKMKLAAELDAKTSGKKLSKQGITTNEALSSFLCQLLARLFEFEDHVPCAHSTMFNWRGRLPNLSLNFAGNASSGIRTCDFFAGSTLGDVASKMNQGLDVFKTNQKYVVEHCELFLDTFSVGINAHMAEPQTLPYLASKPSSIVTNNFARYPIYDVDFGIGKPILVVPHHCGDQVLIWPSATGEGVDLYFQGNTSLIISRLNEVQKEWFLNELNKFETNFDLDMIQNWFSSGDKKLHNNKNLSPIHISKFPGNENKWSFDNITSAIQSIASPALAFVGFTF